MEVECACGYKWNTKTKLASVSCPNCMKKIKVRIVEKVIPKPDDVVVVKDEPKEKVTEDGQ